MKKTKRLFITGSVQSMFFENFLRDQALKLNLKGYLRKLQDGRMEVFIEGQGEEVEQMKSICQRGPQHAQIRSVEETPASFQGFKEFKILKI